MNKNGNGLEIWKLMWLYSIPDDIIEEVSIMEA
jgi:hypothetical protein